MKSKAPLALMEQMVMLLVFALAAALCLQAFVKSEDISQRSEDKDRAVEMAQSAAEVLKSCGGDFEAAAAILGEDALGFENQLAIFYDRDWQMQPPIYEGNGGRNPEEGFALFIHETDNGVPGLGTAELWVRSVESVTEYFRMEIAWQEVDVNG